MIAFLAFLVRPILILPVSQSKDQSDCIVRKSRVQMCATVQTSYMYVRDPNKSTSLATV